MNADQLQKANARLGDAVLDPAIWPQIMDEISSAIGATGAILLQTDVRLNTLTVPFTESIREVIESYFHDGWYLRDSRARGIPLLKNGVPVYSDPDVITPEQRRTDPYYNEFVFPGGIDWFAAIGFRSGTALWALCMQRSAQQGPFQEQETRLLTTLAQPMTEVATLSNAVGRIALLGSTNALNAVRHPAVAIDYFGFVLEENSAMGTVYDDELRIRNNRLLVADPDASAALEHLIGRITASADKSTLTDIEPIVIRRRARRPVLLRVLPVPAAARSPFLGALAILTFTSLEPKSRPDATLLMRAFGLTPAEARLAMMLADGTSIDTAAQELSITRDTARNQLKSVFNKTGTHRQSQLVAMLVRL